MSSPAAISVGVVTRSALEKTRLKSFQASAPAFSRSRPGMCANWKRLSGMKWLVATTGTPTRREAEMAARPTTKCACTWTTSGAILPISRSSRVGTVIRMVGWTSVGAERSLCTVTPSTCSVLPGPSSEAHTTWTSFPRSARPWASRWAK